MAIRQINGGALSVRLTTTEMTMLVGRQRRSAWFALDVVLELTQAHQAGHRLHIGVVAPGVGQP